MCKEYSSIESQIEKEKHQALHAQMSSLLSTTLEKKNFTWKTIERKKTKAKENYHMFFFFRLRHFFIELDRIFKSVMLLM